MSSGDFWRNFPLLCPQELLGWVWMSLCLVCFLSTNVSRLGLTLLSTVTSWPINQTPSPSLTHAVGAHPHLICAKALLGLEQSDLTWPSFASILDNDEAILPVQLQKQQNASHQHFYQLCQVIRELPTPNHNTVCQPKSFWTPENEGTIIHFYCAVEAKCKLKVYTDL